ncbi:MAG: peptidase [Candidatus Dadabacteria bacterium]
MKKVIKNWIHIPGIHCGSTALRDVVAYYRYSLSEAMCFGLGGGLGFFYTKGENLSPSRIIHLRGPGMEPNFFSLIDKPTSWKYESDEDKAFQVLKDWIDRDVPVLIQTDIYYLDYYKSSTYFPGHIVSVWGYDDETERVFLGDTGFEGLQAVPYDDFKKGRVSKAPPFPLNNNWFEVNLKKPIPPLSEIIPEAIHRNARFMIEGTRSARGESSVKMIKLWAEELPTWADAPDWRWCVRFAYQVIERRGTGGGGFRWIYRDFLREAEKIVPALKGFKLSEKMDLIGRKWSELSMILKQISESERDEDLFRKAAGRARDLGEIEEEFYRTAIEVV